MTGTRSRQAIAQRSSDPRRWSHLVSCTAAVCLLGAIACAPKQRVPLEVRPLAAAIYLDGERLEEIPRELKLRSDRDHTLFFKSEGHRSEMIVLRSALRDGKPRLEPAGVRLRLTPLDPTRRELTIEGAVEASEVDAPAADGAGQPGSVPGKQGRIEP